MYVIKLPSSTNSGWHKIHPEWEFNICYAISLSLCWHLNANLTVSNQLTCAFEFSLPTTPLAYKTWWWWWWWWSWSRIRSTSRQNHWPQKYTSILSCFQFFPPAFQSPFTYKKLLLSVNNIVKVTESHSCSTFSNWIRLWMAVVSFGQSASKLPFDCVFTEMDYSEE